MSPKGTQNNGGELVPVPTIVHRNGKEFTQTVWRRRDSSGPGSDRPLPPAKVTISHENAGYFEDDEGAFRRSSDGHEVDEDGDPIIEAEVIDDGPKRREELPILDAEVIEDSADDLDDEERVARNRETGEERYVRRKSRGPATNKTEYDERMQSVISTINEDRDPPLGMRSKAFHKEIAPLERRITLQRKRDSAERHIRNTMSQGKNREFDLLMKQTEDTNPSYFRKTQQNYLISEFIAANDEVSSPEQEQACADLASDYHLMTGSETSWHTNKSRGAVRDFQHEVATKRWSGRAKATGRFARSTTRQVKNEADDWVKITTGPFQMLGRIWRTGR